MDSVPRRARLTGADGLDHLKGLLDQARIVGGGAAFAPTGYLHFDHHADALAYQRIVDTLFGFVLSVDYNRQGGGWKVYRAPTYVGEGKTFREILFEMGGELPREGLPPLDEHEHETLHLGPDHDRAMDELYPKAGAS